MPKRADPITQQQPRRWSYEAVAFVPNTLFGDELSSDLGDLIVVGFNEGLLGAIKRREALLQTFLSAVSFPLIIPTNDASAETDLQENFRMYEDEMNKFRILVPQDWLAGAGEASGIKSVTAFYPEEASDSNVSIVITGIGPDFTRLESFGSVDAFAESLVNGLDRSWQRPPGLAAKLVDSKAANGLYYLEYTLQNPGEKRRHILSAVGMASNGWYNRLYTVTGQRLTKCSKCEQYMEDESEKYRPKIEKYRRSSSSTSTRFSITGNISRVDKSKHHITRKPTNTKKQCVGGFGKKRFQSGRAIRQ
ncbi:PsbP domain-containing protein 3, chloroplastic [Ananas comosus]|uniref:PsbP domain-containing protein 3, chloroplastic n=1 Tax=Ananas comosus TaxID=4615 RepID=A0A199UES4_ANACO|nr:PsbP domain-containing protein 3, chloroplastic [Ananas comosus]